MLILREKYIFKGTAAGMMKLHKVLEELAKSGLYVFRTSDLSRMLHLSNEAAAVYIYRMKQKGMVYPVEKGKFSISSDAFAVSTQLVVPSCISFSTALYLHGRLEQVIDSIFVVSPKKKAHMEFMGTWIRFVRFPPFRVYGCKKVRKGDSFVMLADLEKAAVDCLYMPRYTPVSQVYDALSDGFNRELLEDYALRMKSEAVVRRAGWLIEALGKETGLSPATSTVYTLNPTIRHRGTYNRKWKLYVNEVVQ